MHPLLQGYFFIYGIFKFQLWHGNAVSGRLEAQASDLEVVVSKPDLVGIVFVASEWQRKRTKQWQRKRGICGQLTSKLEVFVKLWLMECLVKVWLMECLVKVWLM